MSSGRLNTDLGSKDRQQQQTSSCYSCTTHHHCCSALPSAGDRAAAEKVWGMGDKWVRCSHSSISVPVGSAWGSCPAHLAIVILLTNVSTEHSPWGQHKPWIASLKQLNSLPVWRGKRNQCGRFSPCLDLDFQE